MENDLDFIGNEKQIKTTHQKTGYSDIAIVDTFTYDQMNRLKTHTQGINGSSAEMIAKNDYDALGQLVGKGVGNLASSNSRLQDIAYSYNVRGWLIGINDVDNIGNDLFTFELSYNNPELSGSVGLYNGNISEAIWLTANDKLANSGNINRGYQYEYDSMNRLISADNFLNNNQTYKYRLETVYDKNGNLTNLKRGGSANYYLIDDLDYNYDSGNKLMNVTDNGTSYVMDQGFIDGTNSGNDYSYDTNGNLTSDANKGITEIQYNHLNMPTKVTVTGANAGVLDYTYSADGIKLQKKKTVGTTVTTTDYAGSFVYENNTLKQFTQSEGYVEPDGNDWQYVYQYKDIWHNVRVTYADDNNNGSVTSSEIRREQNYYPFGLSHQGYNGGTNGLGNTAAKRYGFGGKELQDETFSGNTLDWYDISARNYDPTLGRWMTLDPLAEKFNEWSPYNYTYNNPLNFIDPSGMGPEDIRIWGKDENDNDILLVNLVSEEIDTDIKTDIKIPEAVGDVIKGHDPVTNKVNETESGAIIETDLNPLLEKAISSLPEKKALPMLSIGFEYAAGKGESYSLDLVFMHDNSKIDALAVYGTSGKGYGISAEAGVSAGFLTARDDGPLSLESISGKSNIFSVGIPGIPGGGSYISNDTYTGKLYSLGGKGAGVSKMNTTSTLKGGWGNLSKYF